ncbi:MAG TPA: ABC transporter ATP-binding protein [Firmicutes bacterium]|nr:ABC transporter ATP-binding protein [Bacillota bacterium]
MEAVLELRGIVKRFPGVVANAGIDLSVEKGEIRALLGENGAGKTTLMNILYGLYRPDEGQILIRGREVEITSPRVAISLGIGMVHQHFMLIPPLTVAENVVLGTRVPGAPLLNLREVRARIKDLAARYGLDVPPEARVEQLSVGQQQRVEIVKALYRGADILILDEPTAVLTPQETEELFGILRGLKEAGHTILFISHKLKEVTSISDRVTVLKQGRVVGTVPTAGTDERQLARMMVGREVLFQLDRPQVELGPTVLEVEDLYVRDDRDLEAVRGLSLQVRAGQIFGVAGVDGNGQAELVEAITGLRRIASGRVRLQGEDIGNRLPRLCLLKGLAHIPQDRQVRGLVMDMSVAENMVLDRCFYRPFSRSGWLDIRNIEDHARRLVGDYDIRCPSPGVRARLLSGGNQQKVVLARALSWEPCALIAMHPTRGLDVGATEYVHRRLLQEKARGCGILLVSTELDEIMALSDVIGVMYQGRLVGVVPREEADIEKIGLMMAGAQAACA